jgi:hypothetical protein
MFHFPTFPPHALCVQARVTPHDWCGVPPFGHPRINARLAAPRGLSQPPTSFIGSWCPGIHRVPLTTCPNQPSTQQTNKKRTRPPPPTRERAMCRRSSIQDARVHCAVLKQQPDTTPRRPHRPRPPATTRRHEDRTVWDPERPGQRKRAPPPAEARSGPVPSGPNSVPTTTTGPRPPSPPRPRRNNPSPKERTAVLGAGRPPAAELVSVPPSSTTPHTRRPPPHGTADHGAGAALHRQTRSAGASAP